MADVNDRTQQGRAKGNSEGQPRDEEVRKGLPLEQENSQQQKDQDFGQKDPQQSADDNINQNSTDQSQR